MSVGVNPPRTPITKGSNGIAAATLPNICKMPGPPAPFVPTPLPNIGKSGDKPKGYTKKVLVESKPVAVRGASFGSMGDMASKGTGGGIISANTHGPCKFISPGSLDVKFEGKNVHLLGDMVTNNGAASGIPANSATMMGTVQAPSVPALPVLEFDSNDFSEKTANMKTVMRKNNSMTLTRQKSRSAIRKNRRKACKGHAKAPAGRSLDEFPFASSKQGGAGAAVAAIPVNEQNRQGGKMSAFYQKHGLKDGDSYVVKIV